MQENSIQMYIQLNNMKYVVYSDSEKCLTDYDCASLS